MRYFLEASNLSRFPKIRHAFTTTLLNTDFDRLSVKLNALRSHFYSLNQIHSDKVVYLGPGMDLRDLPDADALVTDRLDVIIGVRTADCLPILVYDCERQVVAAIHAGYRGLLKGIIQNTFDLMVSSLKCDPKNFYVALGPSICVEHYEVGDEVIAAFEKEYAQDFVYSTNFGDKPHLDLKKTAELLITKYGVDPLHFEDLELCTHEHSDLFASYRRDQSPGRQFNCIGLLS